MESKIVDTSRKGWVDALRGLAILLVMYSHCIGNMPGYIIFTGPVKMPLFYAILKVAWACLICGIYAVILNRYLPFAVGKINSNNNVKK